MLSTGRVLAAEQLKYAIILRGGVRNLNVSSHAAHARNGMQSEIKRDRAIQIRSRHALRFFFFALKLNA